MSQTSFPHNEKIITTTLEGLIAAREEFTHLTGCDDWSFWLNHPEYMIGSCMMRHTKQTLPNLRIWPEVAPKYVSTATDIRQGRIDIVFDDTNYSPSLGAILATMKEKSIVIAHSFGMTLKSYSKKNQRDDCEVGCVCSGVYAIEPVGV